VRDDEGPSAKSPAVRRIEMARRRANRSGPPEHSKLAEIKEDVERLTAQIAPDEAEVRAVEKKIEEFEAELERHHEALGES